jgi:transposase-like protein
MASYTAERKASVLKKLLPPHNMTIAEVSKLEGISDATLYNWRTKAKHQGAPVPGSGKTSDKWSAEAKLAVVIETAAMSESELSAYCRSKGLYSEQIKQWKQACITGQQNDAEHRKLEREQGKKDKKKIKGLERELARKEKALAETAALLVLRKKFNALWEEKEDD